MANENEQEQEEVKPDSMGVFDMRMPEEDVDMVKEHVAKVMEVVYAALKDRTGKASEDISQEMAEGIFPVLLNVYSRGAFRAGVASKSTVIDLTEGLEEEKEGQHG